jgi:hypothetical protein
VEARVEPWTSAARLPAAGDAPVRPRPRSGRRPHRPHPRQRQHPGRHQEPGRRGGDRRFLGRSVRRPPPHPQRRQPDLERPGRRGRRLGRHRGHTAGRSAHADDRRRVHLAGAHRFFRLVGSGDVDLRAGRLGQHAHRLWGSARRPRDDGGSLQQHRRREAIGPRGRGTAGQRPSSTASRPSPAQAVDRRTSSQESHPEQGRMENRDWRLGRWTNCTRRG